MDRCPICRARLEGAATCRRCRAELGSALAAAAAAVALEGRAMACLALGQPLQATRLLQRARRLRASPQARMLERLATAALEAPASEPGAAADQPHSWPHSW